jgi:hypothetical protein
MKVVLRNKDGGNFTNPTSYSDVLKPPAAALRLCRKAHTNPSASVVLPNREKPSTRNGDGFSQHPEKKQRTLAKLLLSQSIVCFTYNEKSSDQNWR